MAASISGRSLDVLLPQRSQSECGRDSLAKWVGLFNKIDVDGSGTISMEEMNHADDFVQHAFGAGAMMMDDELTLMDFVNIMSALDIQAGPEPLDVAPQPFWELGTSRIVRLAVFQQYSAIFKLLDEDGEGEVSGSRLSIALRIPPSQADVMMAEADTDGNGLLDFMEFVAFMTARDTTADYNANNNAAVVSDPEVQRYKILFNLLQNEKQEPITDADLNQALMRQDLDKENNPTKSPSRVNTKVSPSTTPRNPHSARGKASSPNPSPRARENPSPKPSPRASPKTSSRMAKKVTGGAKSAGPQPLDFSEFVQELRMFEEQSQVEGMALTAKALPTAKRGAKSPKSAPQSFAALCGEGAAAPVSLILKQLQTSPHGKLGSYTLFRRLHEAVKYDVDQPIDSGLFSSILSAFPGSALEEINASTGGVGGVKPANASLPDKDEVLSMADIPAKELNLYKEIFAEIDTDNSMTVDKEELMAAMSVSESNILPQEILFELLAEVDLHSEEGMDLSNFCRVLYNCNVGTNEDVPAKLKKSLTTKGLGPVPE